MDTRRYLAYLENKLTPKRLEHSLGVMHVMGELSDVYGLDRDQALLTGLLHDAAKDLDPDQQAEILGQTHIEIHHDCDRDYARYLHGPVGAFLVQCDLGVTAPLTLDAITMHTYYGVAATFDAPLCWCVRFSDVLEPYRDWSGVRWLRDGLGCFCKEVYAGRLAEAALLQSGWLVQWFDECNIPVHPNMRRIYHELSARLGVDESFLG